MLSVHITNSDEYLTEDEIIVKMPENRKYLVFDLESDYFIDVITADTPMEEDLMNFICSTDKYNDILKSAIRRSLTTLTYIFYMTTNSIDETVKRLNALELEEVIWSMIGYDVIEIFRYLYEAELKKDELE